VKHLPAPRMALLALFAALLLGPCLSSSYAGEQPQDPSQILARLRTLSATLRQRLTEQEQALTTSQDELSKSRQALSRAEQELTELRELSATQLERSTELGQALSEASQGVEIARQSLTRLTAYWESYQTNMERTLAEERAARLEAERAAVAWKYVGIAGLASGALGVVWGLTR
jgi:ABC-type transporter Mla subunit MlaD